MSRWMSKILKNVFHTVVYEKILMATERVCADVYGMLAQSYMTEKEIQDVIFFVNEQLKPVNDTCGELDILITKAKKFTDLDALNNYISSKGDISDQDLKYQVSLCVMYSIGVKIMDDVYHQKKIRSCNNSMTK